MAPVASWGIFTNISMITMIFLTIGASAISGYCSLPGGSESLAVVPGAVGGCGAVIVDAGDGVWPVAADWHNKLHFTGRFSRVESPA